VTKPLPIASDAPETGADGTRARAAPATGSEKRFVVEGLCCASEARQIEARLGSDPAVRSLRIDPVRHTLTVDGDIDAAAVERAVAELGMTARSVDAPLPGPSWWGRRSRAALATVAGVLWLASLAASRGLASDAVGVISAVGAVVAGGWYVFPRGYRAALNRALDMNFLMSAAAVGALLIGEYVEAASVMFLFAVAQLLETFSMERARNAIRSLMDLTPSLATVVRDGHEVRVRADAVAVGETVVVRPGEKIPVDGVVLTGRSAVDQAAITGESILVAKERGDDVFAGTLNGDGVLEARSTHAPADTTLARIIHSVEEAHASRAPSQTFVERFARVYTPAVVGTALLVATLPPLLAGASWAEWVYRALALLVVACPCALVISTPVTVVSALAGAARRGILIKGGLHLETAGRARVVALDKTGTLTEGRPEVVSVVPLDGVAPAHVLALAAAVEARSEHPLAAAIVERARAEGVFPRSAVAMRALPGRGAEAVVDGRRVVVGSERLFHEEGVPTPTRHPEVRRLEGEGRTVVLVGVFEEGELDAGGRAVRVVGAIALADRPRAGAAAAIDGLRRAGIGQVVMLTGDNAVTAESVARGLGSGLTAVRAGLLPADKVTALRELREAHGPVLMVGDGINDAPALAAADVGIAMGAAGTDVALETADIALMGDDLAGLPTLIRLARRAESIIRCNITFALAVKAIFVLLAITGVATLWMAVLADMGASLLVIANGMRALRPGSGTDAQRRSA
jgi:Zn2+/Cd2+-exporting ATPase